MNFGIIANPGKTSLSEPLERICHWIESAGYVAIVSPEVRAVCPPSTAIRVVKDEMDVVERADVMLSIGGDGTMLWTARLVQDRGIPILAINSGRLGFMANVPSSGVEEALQRVATGAYEIDRRFMIEAEDGTGHIYHALNEILFTKKETAAMVRVVAWQGEELINRYWSDGLLVSTPTGSTAYNLSAGGPIVKPDTEVFILTALNPHTLTTRPIVLSSHQPLRLEVPKQDNEVLFSVDGFDQKIPLYPFYLDIRQSAFYIQLVRLPQHHFFETLRNKLMWGIDYRDATGR
jgi:NAD+ kinase